MRCQKCQTKQANVKLTMNINGQMKQLQLCSTCYAEIQQGMKKPSGIGFFGNNFDQMFEGFIQPPHGFEQTQHSEQMQAGQGSGGVLEDLGQNLSNGAKAGLIDPVIGRDKEVNQVIKILNRRNKNNPVLIGEPGVGKTAIAEGLALKIAEGDVPTKLANKEIYLLDVASLVANTGIRGQFEERMKQLISELKSRKNVILFVDEIHLLVGAGSAEGSMDAGNILKPALARGELQVIGATTLKEYRQIEKDAALERRFQPVMVKEPTVEESVDILKGLQPKYEQYHDIRYSDEAIQACVQLSHRYIQDRFLPDKAIDLLDEAGANLNLEQSEMNSDDIETRLAEITKEKDKAAEAEDYERAANLRTQELQLQQKLNNADEDVKKLVVEVAYIQEIIEEKTCIPVGKLQEDEQSKLKNLAERLDSKVIGQEGAVQKVAKAIRRSRAGLKAKTRPIGSFLFVGPTGVGKTELTKCLAEELFGTKDAYIRFDMSEYMEKHSVSKLIGSPPGYVGHEEAGQLTERVRRNPYSIVLLDEIEKAHPDVQHMFLQIMEDGRLTDSQGRTVSFKDTVIIMTSNAGTGEKKVTVGFGQDGETDAVSTLEALSSYFKPEFLNRFDAIIPFNELKEEHLVQIVELMLTDLNNNVKEEGLSIVVSEDAKMKLATLGYDPRFGARPLRRVIQEKIEDKIADVLIDEEDVSTISVDFKDNEFVVKNSYKR
ncbi:ATP-dependent Clp protease ATP-binding subunit [Desertibacillus haloalkaliphilus]|uniref:ATP-dependent Clp protease ATP-binding subunit n=1 Tax=Desertibacillus haloalkaliphilus TaxID=1328930 RepID=UPI001C2629D6|nr:ATP-dependent Clp protease ATP-binding subunit [Desertibacillus haloalkaliphilus]MBU8906940.1 AAA family ATPase [Desertibacillus haloalkaliphilus]